MRARPFGWTRRLARVSATVSIVASIGWVLSGCGDSVPDPEILCFTDTTAEGNRLITCDNGVDVVVAGGAPGRDGTSCGAAEDGSRVIITCDDGSRFIVDDGEDGSSCHVADATGGIVVSCDDGSEATLSDGAVCSVARDDAAGSVTVTCEDGTTATVFDGEDGPDCTVSEVQNQNLVRVDCGDNSGTVVEQGETCAVEEDPETLDIVISCDGGSTEVVIAGTDRVARVEGLATLFDQTDHSNIEVTIVETEETTDTDQDGNYAFAQVFPGTYELLFEYPDYASQTVTVHVLPGVVVVDPVVLKRAQRVSERNDVALLEVCEGDEIAVIGWDEDHDGLGMLGVWDDRVGELVLVVPEVVLLDDAGIPVPLTAQCLPGGHGVYYYEIEPDDEAARTWSAETGEVHTVFSADDPVFVWNISPAGDTLWLWSADGEENERIDLYDVDTGDLTEIASGLEPLVIFEESELGCPDGAFAPNTYEGYVLPVVISPDGQSVAYQVGTELRVFRRGDGSTLTLPAADDIALLLLQFSQDGSRTLYQYDPDFIDAASLALLDIPSGTQARPITTSALDAFVTPACKSAELSPDGHWVAFQNTETIPPDGLPDYPLYLFDGRDLSDTSLTLLNTQVDLGVRFSPDSSQLAYLREYDVFDDPEFDLTVRDLEAGTEVNPSDATSNPPEFSPDSGWLAFVESDFGGGGDLGVLEVGVALDGDNPDAVDSSVFDVVWAPDSESLIYDDVSFGVWLYDNINDPEGGPTWLSNTSVVSDFEYSFDGQFLAHTVIFQGDVNGPPGLRVWDVDAAVGGDDAAFVQVTEAELAFGSFLGGPIPGTEPEEVDLPTFVWTEPSQSLGAEGHDLFAYSTVTGETSLLDEGLVARSNGMRAMLYATVNFAFDGSNLGGTFFLTLPD